MYEDPHDRISRTVRQGRDGAGVDLGGELWEGPFGGLFEGGRSWRWVVAAAVAVGVAAGLWFGGRYVRLALFERNPRFTLRHINMVSASAMTKAEIGQITGIVEGKNLFALNPAAIRRNVLLAVPNIQDIRIERVPPDTVNVTVMERAAMARSPEERRTVLDYDGYCFSLQPVQDAQADVLPCIRSEEWASLGPGQRSSERIRMALNALDVVDYMGVNVRVAEVDTTGPLFLVLRFANEREVALPWGALRDRRATLTMLQYAMVVMNATRAAGYVRFEVVEEEYCWKVFAKPK
ncbi:MAG: FtsQ-type POTRA domain-containing protein [Kiritimatiellaeota bacterium]|nr:FtsQ-type POTRA domain-containing protein [Kiritimatiellota bacterium]